MEKQLTFIKKSGEVVGGRNELNVWPGRLLRKVTRILVSLVPGQISKPLDDPGYVLLTFNKGLSKELFYLTQQMAESHQNGAH